jgi:hypothetical protein
MPDPTTTGLTVALVYAALSVAHGLGDTWVQRHRHALAKGARDRRGQAACAAHVTTYTLTTTVAVLLVWGLPLGTHITWAGFAAGQAFSAVTHYAIDRRWTLLAAANLAGKRDYHDLGTPRPLTVLATRRVLVTDPAGAPHEEDHDERVPLDNPPASTGANSLDRTAHHAALFASALLTALI